MSSRADISRRSFLRVVGGAGASFVLGSFAIASCSPSPVALNLGTEGKADKDDLAKAFAPNGYTRLDPDGKVTITICRSDMGQGVRTSLAMLAAEEMDADWSTVKVTQAGGGNFSPAGGGTGGSSTIRSMHDQMRKMGAASRLMLISAAAKQWGVDPASCKTDSGKVIAPDGRTIPYAELTALAAQEPVPPASSLKLKDPSQFKILGKGVAKLDNPDIVTGKAIYGIDAKVDGMVYASIERPPQLGGSVANLDDSAARQVPGVTDVVKVSHGVAVIGSNTWACFSGRQKLKVTWNPGSNPDLTTAAITAKLKAAMIDPPAMPQGAKVIEADYSLPYLAHATMEPMNATANVKDDSCEVWAPTQSPDGAARQVARMLGLTQDKVKVNVTLLGGGFGRRSNPDFIVEAVEISKAIKKPVKLTWTREDDMKGDTYRPACQHQLKGAIDSSSKPVGWSHQAIQAGWGNDDSFGGGDINYNIPNAHQRFTGVNVGVPVGPWRSVENSLLNVVNECFIDEMAHAAGADPFEFRKQLAGDDRFRNVLEIVAKNGDWGKALPSGWGRGIAGFVGYGTYVAHVAEVSVIGGKVQVHRIVAAVDCGQAYNPKGVDALMQGGISDGVATALRAAITIDKGGVVQNSWTDYQWTTMDIAPKVEVTIVQSAEGPGGMGEPPYPSVAPAIANAVFAATGKRVRKFPIKLEELV